jgi:hypothetical protein
MQLDGKQPWLVLDLAVFLHLPGVTDATLDDVASSLAAHTATGPDTRLLFLKSFEGSGDAHRFYSVGGMEAQGEVVAH